eukprot:TRINITY_DN437_c0_g4_i2.p1 TRINITY_DN437_c0_g4~~TRINITY_DN437_c0_g4_i2.p1  ORF type:complete len:212 (+),score=54.00 TRINITY_DN437_c0_g4_i2:93-728(+)
MEVQIDDSLIAETFKEIKELMESATTTENGWDPLSLPPGCSGAWTRSNAQSSVRLVRSQAEINASVDTVGDYMWNETAEAKKKDDETLLEHTVVVEPSNELRLLYQLYKLPWPISNRDALFYAAIKRDEKGARYHIGKSIPNQDVVKTPSGTVRAQVLTSAYVMQPLEGNKTLLTYVVQLDPKGSLPTALVNSSQGKSAKRVVQIRDNVQK